MFKTLGIVEVPAGNAAVERFFETLASRRFGGKTLLEWVTRRMTEALLLEHVVVIASGEHYARRIACWLPADVSVFAAPSEFDPLARFAAALSRYDAGACIRVTLDNPFVDPVLIDRLVAKAESYRFCDYMSYCSSGGKLALLARVGMIAEWCRAAAVFRADEIAQSPEERGDACRFLHSHPELFQLRLVPVPEPLDREDMRLRLEVEEDWDHAHIILEALGPENLDYQRIANLLDQHPAMRERMAALNRLEFAQ